MKPQNRLPIFHYATWIKALFEEALYTFPDCPTLISEFELID